MAIGDKKSAVMQSDIVNDFTTGGATNVLSAEMGKTLAQRSNPNLLDNWYFVDPINQRAGYIVPIDTDIYDDTGLTVKFGITTQAYKVLHMTDTYAEIRVTEGIKYAPISAVVHGYTGFEYSIDRWKVLARDNDMAILTSDGYALYAKDGRTTNYQPYIKQYIDQDLRGKEVTLSIMYKGSFSTDTDPAIYFFDTNTQTPAPVGYVGTRLESSPDKWNVHSLTTVVPTTFTDIKQSVIIRGSLASVSNGYNMTVKAVKLELGTEQTLAHQDTDGNWVLNEIPNRAEQLLKCSQSTADASDTYANGKTGFALAGYGWGGQSKHYVFLNDDDGSKFENAIAPFIASMKTSAQYAIAFQSHPFFNSVSCQGVIVRTGTRVVIKGVNYYGEGIQRIWDDNIGWFPWEWINPPMRQGVEYRTTERYLDKPVYVQVVNFGAMPVNTYKQIYHNIKNIDKVFEVSGVANTATNQPILIPNTSFNTGYWYAEVALSADRNLIQIVTKADSGYTDLIQDVTAIVKLRYTKTTN